MTSITRRTFNRLAGGALALSTAGAGRAAFGQDAKPRVVVIGGGAGGATVARYIAKDSQGAINVTLVEPKERYTTCFFSNLYLGGLRDMGSITHSYDGLEAEGVKIVHQMADGIDADAKEVAFADGGRLPYDRLVVSPGIDFVWESIEGYSEDLQEKIPHAYKAGDQTEILRRQLEAMEDGGTFLIVPPPNPYRCPPGPYERASMAAHYFKENKPGSSVVILDPKESFSKQDLFVEGWNKHYPGMVEWLGADFTGGPKALDADAMTVTTDDGTDYEGAVINLIPAQKAGEIAQKAGLADDSGWCPIEASSMESTLVPDIYVLGDSSIAGDMPKSGFSANSQAKTCAMKIRAALAGQDEFPARYRNTCWSLIEEGDAVKVGANYEPQDGKITATEKFISQTEETAELREETAEEAVTWYESITADMFGSG